VVNIKTALASPRYYVVSSVIIFLILTCSISFWYLLYAPTYSASCVFIWMIVKKISTKNINSIFFAIVLAIFCSIFQWWLAAKFAHISLYVRDLDILSQLNPFWMYPHDMKAMKIQVPLFFVAVFIRLKIKKPMKNQSSQSQSAR